MKEAQTIACEGIFKVNMTMKETWATTLAMMLGDHDHEENNDNNDGVRWPQPQRK
jgi:hypothetical protein